MTTTGSTPPFSWHPLPPALLFMSPHVHLLLSRLSSDTEAQAGGTGGLEEAQVSPDGNTRGDPGPTRPNLAFAEPCVVPFSCLP